MLKLNHFNADRITAMVFLALGAGVTYGGFIMDRLEIRKIHPASIPGLLPMLLGIALMVCAAILYYQTKNSNSKDATQDQGGIGRLILVLALTVIYAVGIVGTLPFWAATFIFVSAFICIFEWPSAPTSKQVTKQVIKQVARLLVIAAVEGALVAVAVSLLFEKAFLVRLP